MDIYIEHMVKRKKNAFDIATVLMLVLIGLFLLYFSTYAWFISPMIMLFLIVGIIYGTYKFIVRINMEYEYTVTNCELDIDKIINKRTRKNVETINLRLIEDFGICGDNKESRYLNDKSYKRIIVCESVKEGYAFVAYTKDDKKKILFFTPSQEIIDHIRKVNPGKF